MQPASPSLGPNYNLLEGPVHEASIYRRNGGCAVQVDAKVYVWGGEGGEKRSFDAPAQGTDSDDSDSDDESDEDQVVEDVWIVTTLPPTRLSTYPFDVYDMQTCTWSRQKTSGDAPLLGLGSSLCYHPETCTIYLFGGWKQGFFDADIYRVRVDPDVDEWHWERVEMKPGAMKPSGRYLTGVLLHESRLCILGGVGTDIVKTAEGQPQDLGARYAVAYTQGEGFGWNNEYYEFDIEYDEWSAPLDKDALRPAPLGGQCFTKFDTHRALLFGGRYEGRGRVNDTWIFDLEQRKFTGPLKFSDAVPTGRAFATLTPLIDPLTVGQRIGGCGLAIQQRMLLLWGKQENDVILPEAWILKMRADDHFAWTQVDIDLFPRSWHTATPLYYTNTTECRLAIFGGNVHSDGFTGKRRNAGDMRVLTFGVPSLSRLCAGVIAREGKALSSYNLPSHSQAYKQIHIAIETLSNATPIKKEHFYQ